MFSSQTLSRKVGRKIQPTLQRATEEEEDHIDHLLIQEVDSKNGLDLGTEIPPINQEKIP